MHIQLQYCEDEPSVLEYPVLYENENRNMQNPS